MVAGPGDVRRASSRVAPCTRRHREHVAVGDVDHHGHAAVRVGRLHLVEQRVLGLPLQVLVERQHDVGAALRVDPRLLRVGDVVTQRVLLDDELARLARRAASRTRYSMPSSAGTVGVHAGRSPPPPTEPAG